MSKPWCLHAHRLFDGERFLGEHYLVVEGERISDLVPAPEAARLKLLPSCLEPVELNPCWTLLPGMINTHSHVSIVPSLGDQLGQLCLPREDQLGRARPNMARELATGVTTLRVMGQELGVDFILSEEIRAGSTPGPELLCAGRHLTRAGFHGHALSGVTDLASLRSLASDNIRQGARLLKVFVSGGISSDSGLEDCPFTLEELQTVVELAHDHGIPVAAHALSGPGIERALEAGIDSIEHAALLSAAQLDRVVASGTPVVGTFSILFHPEGIEAEAAHNARMRQKLDHYRPRVEACWRRILESPAKVALGTDSVHGAMAFEVSSLMRLGASLEFALRAATSNASSVCRLDDRGRIAAGLRADLLAVAGDLQRDPEMLGHPALVIQGGVWKTGKPGC